MDELVTNDDKKEVKEDIETIELDEIKETNVNYKFPPITLLSKPTKNNNKNNLGTIIGPWILYC